MKCWICGNEGKTREHMTKASDLRALFPNVSQKYPIYYHTDQRRNQKLGSVKSDKLKFKVPICAHCNNVRTTNHDRSWESLSKHLREKKPPIKEGDLIQLNEIFPGSVASSMLDVHLYFVKLFGCAIVQGGLPFDIVPFSEAIMDHKPHPKIYLAFISCLNMGTGWSDVEMEIDNLTKKCAFSTWFYFVDSHAVNVMYAEPNENRQGLTHAWHPSTISNCIYIGE